MLPPAKASSTQENEGESGGAEMQYNTTPGAEATGGTCIHASLADLAHLFGDSRAVTGRLFSCVSHQNRTQAPVHSNAQFLHHSRKDLSRLVSNIQSCTKP
jgi:hypothetical protein